MALQQMLAARTIINHVDAAAQGTPATEGTPAGPKRSFRQLTQEERTQIAINAISVCNNAQVARYYSSKFNVDVSDQAVGRLVKEHKAALAGAPKKKVGRGGLLSEEEEEGSARRVLLPHRTSVCSVVLDEVEQRTMSSSLTASSPTQAVAYHIHN